MALAVSPGLTTTPNRRASPRPNLGGGFGLIKGSVQAVQNDGLSRSGRPEWAGRNGLADSASLPSGARSDGFWAPARS